MGRNSSPVSAPRVSGHIVEGNGFCDSERCSAPGTIAQILVQDSAAGDAAHFETGGRSLDVAERFNIGYLELDSANIEAVAGAQGYILIVGERPAVVKYDGVRLAQIMQMEVSIFKENDGMLARNVRIEQYDVALR